MFTLLSLLVCQILAVAANTEKVIFLGPSNLQVPVEHPTLELLHLGVLSPLRWSLRTHVDAGFPTDTAKYGQAAWVLLDGLRSGQRYEVRICWAATQPTSFRLNTYELPTVFETPDLITSLATYTESRQPNSVEIEDQVTTISPADLKSKPAFEKIASVLFLRIQATADYFTMNKTLMEQVPPILVDIILDPFVFNIFPQSLVPTAAYVVILIIGSWVLSQHISRWICLIAKAEAGSEKKTR